MFDLAKLKSLKKLVIAPHVDDEVLGLGGILDSRTHVLHLGLASQQNHGNEIFSREYRLGEWKLVEEESLCSHTLSNHPVNSYQLEKIIPDIEKSVNDHKPDLIFIPNPSYNQDHQAVFSATQIALRPHDINHFVPVVLAYYQPQDLWSPKENIDPNLFIKVDLENHLRRYQMLSSQVRGHRSVDLIKSQLILFGSLANCKYALGFRCHRFAILD